VLVRERAEINADELAEVICAEIRRLPLLGLPGPLTSSSTQPTSSIAHASPVRRSGRSASTAKPAVLGQAGEVVLRSFIRVVALLLDRPRSFCC
jgi:hypothetical protein